MKTKDRCIRGHLQDDENIYLSPKGAKSCRACRAEAMKRFLERHPGYFAQRKKKKGKNEMAEA